MAFGIEGLEIGAPILFGLIISIIEIIFVHNDELGSRWFVHALHAVPFTLLFVFINMNTAFVMSYVPVAFFQGFLGLLVVRVAVGLIATIKIKTAAAVIGGYGEKWPHAIVIGALIIAIPYVWDLVLKSLLRPILPF